MAVTPDWMLSEEIRLHQVKAFLTESLKVTQLLLLKSTSTTTVVGLVPSRRRRRIPTIKCPRITRQGGGK